MEIRPQHDPQDCISELFRDANGMHDLINQLDRQSERLQEMSMNAAIAAGHAGRQTKVFGEIARQIGVVSSQLREAVSEAREITGFANSKLLSSLVKTGQRQKLQESLELLDPSVSAGNLAMVRNVFEVLTAEVGELLGETHLGLAPLQALNDRIRLLNERAWSIVTNLRVCSGLSESGEETLFASIAASLEAMHVETAQVLETKARILDSLNERLVHRCGCIPPSQLEQVEQEEHVMLEQKENLS